MNKYIVSIFFVLVCSKISAQDISIEFSIEWKDKLDFQFKELEQESIRPAYLNITYRNISDSSLYCLKITEGIFGLPEIMQWHDHYFNRNFPLPSDEGYSKRRYFVGFKSNPYYHMNFTWNIRNDTTDIEYKIIKDWERPFFYSVACDGCPIGLIGGDTAVINDWLFYTLDDIYNFIYSNYYPEIQKKVNRIVKEQRSHYSTDITQDTIMNNSRDKFVFLNPGERYVDKYNLIGFQLAGGTFTFQLDDTQSLDYVELEPVYEDNNKMDINHQIKKQLPLKVGEYSLFMGNFLTNKVTVHFPGIKMKE